MSSSVLSAAGQNRLRGLRHLRCDCSWGDLAALTSVGLCALALSGCRHKHQVAYTPAPPPISTAPRAPRPVAPADRPPVASSSGWPAPPVVAPEPGVGIDPADLQYVSTHPAIYTETGTASWYGPPYNRRKGANGQVFDQNMLSAAHRTLPMGSLLKVTNLQNGKSSIMRVTDRGPFVPGRVLDLSVASAKSIGVWQPGTARVRIDVFEAPKPIADGGRWCVQIGAFKDGGKAHKLEDRLQRKYATANVIEFTGPTGHWVRIRPLHDDKERAIEISQELEPEEGAAYLTRLD